MFQKPLLQLRLNSSFFRRLCVGRKPLPKQSVFRLNQKWRKDRGLPLNPNSEGVLTDGPDYSFLDGRSTPFGVGQMKRLVKQRQFADQIIKMTAEIDFAVDRHNTLVQQEQDQRQQILDNKLKPKGIELLRKKH